MSIKKLYREIKQCRDCQDLFGFEPHPIVCGNQKAKIMQISQAPSLLVQKTGRPFNDNSGKKLRDSWYQISVEEFYNPDSIYITSMAHCYPGKAKSGGDRVPPKTCTNKWLMKEIELVDNQIYIIIGSYAAKYLFPGVAFKTLIFEDQVLFGKPAYILPHPSPLNSRWFKENPDFEKERMPFIRKQIHKILDLEER